MGRRTLDEKAKLAEEKRTVSRRRFVLGGGATLLAAVAATSYLATREPPLDPETDDAVRIYKSLKTEVEAKYKEAKREGKPFRIFVLEGHGDVNAVAYKLMLIDICSKLGIQKFLTEVTQNDAQDLANPATKKSVQLPDPLAEANLRMTLEEAVRKEMQVIGMDNCYPSASEMTEAQLNYASQFMHEEIERRYPVTNLSIALTTDKNDQRLEHVGFRIKSGNFSIPLDFSEHGTDRMFFNDALNTARSRALDAMRADRDASMIKEIEKHPASLVIVGKNHAIDLVGKTRMSNSADLTFSISDNATKSEYLSNPHLTPERRAALEWANDPKNAIQTEEKMFNAENLPAFIEKVSQIANQVKGATR